MGWGQRSALPPPPPSRSAAPPPPPRTPTPRLPPSYAGRDKEVYTCQRVNTCAGPTTLSCPSVTVQPQGTVCRPSKGWCDAAEVCDGVSAFCPQDDFNFGVCENRQTQSAVATNNGYMTGTETIQLIASINSAFPALDPDVVDASEDLCDYAQVPMAQSARCSV